MLPRIKSAFILLKRVEFALLLFGASKAFSQEVIWVRNGDLGNSRFGSAMISLGDQNADGFSDWAVFSPGSQQSATDDAWDFFHGDNPPSLEPYLTLHARPGADYYIINAMANIGDFDGDGIEDWAIGLWSAPRDSMHWEFYRGGQGADTIPVASITWPSHLNNGVFTPLGDYNGDGYTDFYYYTGNWDDRGLLYFGASDWNLDVDLINTSVPHGTGKVRTWPDLVGDLNGDGYSDFMASGNGDDSTFFYFGSPNPDTIPEMVWWGWYTSNALLSVDLNGDGATDLIRKGASGVHVNLGGPSFSQEVSYTTNFPGCDRGVTRISSAGDFNADGFEDLAAVSDHCSDYWGMYALYLGAAWPNLNPSIIREGFWEWPFDWVELEFPIGLGDVNGDGIDDVAISCAGEMLESQRGRVVIFAGDPTIRVSADDRPRIVEDFSLSTYPNPFNSTLSISLDIPLHQEVSLTLYDLLGREVDVIHRGRLSATTLSYTAPPELSSGIYFLRAATRTETKMQKVVLLK